MLQVTHINIEPIHKGVSLFLSYTNMYKVNSLHHVKEHPKISNLLHLKVIEVKLPKLELFQICMKIRSKA